MTSESQTPNINTSTPTPEAPEVDTAEQSSPPEEKMSTAGWILCFLLLVVSGAISALYFAPQIKPYVPAAVLPYLFPAEDNMEVVALQDTIAGLEARIDKLETTQKQFASEIEDDTLKSTVADLLLLEGRLNALEERVVTQDPQVSVPSPHFEDETSTDSPVNAKAALPIEDILGKISALESRFETQKKDMVRTAPPSDEAVAQIRERLAVLEQERARAAINAPQDAQDLDALSDRVLEVEQKLKDRFQAQETVGLGVAVAGLLDAAEGIAPFIGQLENVERMTGVPAPNELRTFARIGVPSLLLLTSRFEEESLLALRVATQKVEDAPQSVWQTVKQWGSRLVTVRSRSEQTGDTPSAYISQAETRIRVGDLNAAVRILENLPEESQAAMASWLRDAQDRIDLNNSLSAYRSEILSDTSGI